MAAFACVLPLTIAACGNNGPPDFALSLASGQPAAATITQGGTTPVIIQVSAVKGSTGSITLVLSGLPPGVGVAPGSATVGIGSPQTFQSERRVYGAGDQHAGDADSDRRFGESAQLELDHAHADADAVGNAGASRESIGALTTARCAMSLLSISEPGWTYPYPAAGRTRRP